MYAELLPKLLSQKLENERIEFERKLNAEKQKWQEALNVSKVDKKTMEMKMNEQMEKRTEEQQAEWKNVMVNKVNKEMGIQAQLVNEKILLEEKSKEKAMLLEEKLKKTKSKSTEQCCRDL